jgi:hypothetical protein
VTKTIALWAFFGAAVLITLAAPANAQFVCTTTSSDSTCTNSGTAGPETNTAAGARQNATTTNSGTVNGNMFSETTGG